MLANHALYRTCRQKWVHSLRQGWRITHANVWARSLWQLRLWPHQSCQSHFNQTSEKFLLGNVALVFVRAVSRYTAMYYFPLFTYARLWVIHVCMYIHTSSNTPRHSCVASCTKKIEVKVSSSGRKDSMPMATKDSVSDGRVQTMLAGSVIFARVPLQERGIPTGDWRE